jgi:hypothetical protein
VAGAEKPLSGTALSVLTALGKYGWASETYLTRVRSLSANDIRKGLQELDRAGLVSSSFDRNILTARGRRELHSIREERRLERVRGGTASAHEVSLLADAEIRAAVRRMKPRADREPDPKRLTATFVDPGISEQLDNPNNQIVFGRRGTGKTHVLRVLDDLLASQPGNLVIYLDLRTLGSSSVFEDVERPMYLRATSLIKDVFEPLHAALLDRATRPTAADVDFAPLDSLAAAITRSVLIKETRQAENVRDDSATESATAGMTGAPPFFSLAGASATTAKETSRVMNEGTPIDHILFGQIATALADSLRATAVEHLYLLIDEWTAIPDDLQPYLAEFLKRSLFVIPQVTVKIAALEYRSAFSLPTGRNNLIGFELGADISSSLELDDYFVYDRNAGKTEEVFAEVLFRHLYAEIESRGSLNRGRQMKAGDLTPDGADASAGLDYLEKEFALTSAAPLVDLMFVSKRPYRELVRAGEGVVRDFIGIFAIAFTDSVRRGLRAIDVSSVRESARTWFGTDKESNLDADHRLALSAISGEVIAKGRRRTFMFDRRNEPNETLRSLVDFRVLHLIQRNVLDPKSPMRRYNIYTLDYGLYVDLLDTKYDLKAEFGNTRSGGSADLVPLDNRRYVRGVVLRPEQLPPS